MTYSRTKLAERLINREDLFLRLYFAAKIAKLDSIFKIASHGDDRTKERGGTRWHEEMRDKVIELIAELQKYHPDFVRTLSPGTSWHIPGPGGSNFIIEVSPEGRLVFKSMLGPGMVPKTLGPIQDLKERVKRFEEKKEKARLKKSQHR